MTLNKEKVLANFSISVMAADRIKELLLSENNSYFRVSIMGGGCSGFQYDFSFEQKPNIDDFIFEKNDIKCLIDETSLDFIKGGILDFVSELSGSYFKINNPNATANCGCGTSFSI